MNKIVSYKHWGGKVFVRKDLLGKHREHCLCWECMKFLPNNRVDNCPIANLNYALDVLTHIVTPVWECPEFEKKK